MKIQDITQKRIKEVKNTTEEVARDLKIIEHDEDLQFRGVKLVFTSKDEDFKTEASMLDEDFNEDEFIE